MTGYFVQTVTDSRLKRHIQNLCRLQVQLRKRRRRIGRCDSSRWKQVCKTDGNGKYQFDALELGTYTMAVSKPGYQAFSGEVTIEDKKDNVKDITTGI